MQRAPEPVPAEPVPAETSAAQEFLDTLADPALLELVFLVALVLWALWMLFTLRSALGRLHGRKQLAGYLEGVEAVLAGDPLSGSKLLGPVVAEDPENLGARLALGEAHAALGKPAEAHREHLEARQIFAAEGHKLQLAIVRDLRAAGELGEAQLAVDEALRSAPKDLELQREAWELKLEAGLFEEALPHGRQLLGARPEAGLRRRLAHAAARAGSLRLQRSEAADAKKLFDAALGYDPENHEARKGRILLGEEAAEAAELLRLQSPETALVPVDAEDRPLVELKEDAPGGLPALRLFPECVCSRCGAAVSRGQQLQARFVCDVCGQEAAPVYSEAAMSGRIEDAGALLDEIEENERFVRRLAEDAATGNEVAEHQLRDLGAAAVPACLDVVLAGQSNDKLQGVLLDAARNDPDQLLRWRRETLRSLDQQLLGRFQRSQIDELLGPLLRRLGSAVLPWLREQLRSAPEIGDAAFRGLIVNGYVGTRDLMAFEDLAARLSPVEIVRHLNQIPDEELAPWVAAIPTGPSYAREAILLDTSLESDRAFALALASVDEARVAELASVLTARGPEDELLRALTEMLEFERQAAERAEAVLQSFGAEALSELVASFADPGRERSRERVRRLIHAAGARAVPLLARCFGGAPAEGDERTIELIARIGNPAVPLLAESYRSRPRWFGFVPARRSSTRHPRACKLRALALIATPLARDTLAHLADEESDGELQSLARELLRKPGA